MADHIKVTAADGTWVVRAGGAVLGESNNVLELREGSYPPVIYFPREDIAMDFLDKTTKSSHCPWKGDASYYSIQTKSVLIDNAAWSYEAPLDDMQQIAGYISFYPDKAAVEQL